MCVNQNKAHDGLQNKIIQNSFKQSMICGYNEKKISTASGLMTWTKNVTHLLIINNKLTKDFQHPLTLRPHLRLGLLY